MIAPPASLIEKDKSTLNVLHPEVYTGSRTILRQALIHAPNPYSSKNPNQYPRPKPYPNTNL